MKKMTDDEWLIEGLSDKWELSKDKRKKLELVQTLLSSTCESSLQELIEMVGETEVLGILDLSKEDIQESLKGAVEEAYHEKRYLRKKQKSILLYSIGAQSAAEAEAAASLT